MVSVVIESGNTIVREIPMDPHEANVFVAEFNLTAKDHEDKVLKARVTSREMFPAPRGREVYREIAGARDVLAVV